MASVICEPCIGVCDMACVEVCPVECISGPISLEEIETFKDNGETSKLAGVQLYINPDECIDCFACQDECPVEAILADDEIPDNWEHFIEKNAEFFQR